MGQFHDPLLRRTPANSDRGCSQRSAPEHPIVRTAQGGPLSCAAGSARRYASIESSLRPDAAFRGTRSKNPSERTISGEAARSARHDGSTFPPSSLQSRGHLCKVAQHGRRLSLSAAALQVGGTRANYRDTLSQISRKTFGEALMVQIRFSASTGACPRGAWLSARFCCDP